MKRLLFYTVLILISATALSQSLPESLRREYDTATSSKSKGIILKNYSNNLDKSAIERVKIFMPFLSYFTQKRDNEGIAYIKSLIGILASASNDFETGLKYQFDATEIFENLKDSFGLLSSYTGIAFAYVTSENNGQGLKYWKKSMPLAKILDSNYYGFILNGIADSYNKMNHPDSALSYSQEAVSVGYKIKDSQALSSYLGTLGEIYTSLGQYEIARSFINQSIYWSKLTDDQYILSFNLIAIAKIFLNSNKLDSSLFYARQAIFHASPRYLGPIMQSYELMYKAFEKQNNPDSSNKYFRLSIQIKDSVLSDEKNKSIQTLGFQQEIREKEKEAENEEIARQEKKNIESIVIAIGIITFTILFLLLSRNIIANEKLIRFLGILALLLVFEFTNLLLHSFLAEITHHSQIAMLLLMVSLAALLIPLHHKIEKWALNKIIKRNKELRLLAAKKVIEKLEKPNEDLVQ